MAASLPFESLRAVCDPRNLGFASTAELEPLDGVIGQERALSAAEFAVAMKAPGYNVFVVGPPAVGKALTMRTVLARAAAAEATPRDACYVHNFDDPYRPRALLLPPGRGKELRESLERATAALESRLRRTWDSEEFTRRTKGLADDYGRRERALMKRLEEMAKAGGFTVSATDEGMTMALSPDGKPLTEEQFRELDPEMREQIESRAKGLEAQAEPLMREMRQTQREAALARDQLLADAARSVAADLLGEVRGRFAGLEAVTTYLDAVEQDVVEHATKLAEPPGSDDDDDDDDDDGDAVVNAIAAQAEPAERVLDRYRVNVFCDHEAVPGAPVVSEQNPTYRNLFGRIEHRAQLGTLVTDFMLMKAGALHQANGGYLILEAKDLVADPFAWDALKKALKSRSIRMEEALEELHMLSAASLSPEPIPLDVKVVLLGAPDLYHALYELDDDFRELFKVKADFDESLPRTPEAERLVARFLAGACRAHGLPPFTAPAVARLIEEAGRSAEHRERLSARLGDLVDLMRESAFRAARRQSQLVDGSDVAEAIDARGWRGNLAEEQLSRMTLDGEIKISTSGTAVGEVNGLSVYSIGDHEFGRPFRITARARPGRPGLLDVEREAGLGGAIHSKGVLVLGGFIAGRYASDHPLAMSATLVAEQSYSYVDGDSASCAELCALLSTLSGVPLKQSLAMTGAVSQAGEVQAVGGINQKIEGFFDLCRTRGLTGKEGVLIPASNVRHLMLRADVVEAVRAGRFSVYPVATIDEALALLTGKPPGARGKNGKFPPTSLNGAVEKRLIAFARAVRAR